MTIIGTVATIAAAVTLFPIGHLFWGTMVIWLFVMFDMLDGAMARARGGGTRFGAVLDATCDRIADGAIFAGLAWWCAITTPHHLLLIATLICLVTSQVISYAKARAEASGLYGDGGLIERPDRLIIVLVGAGGHAREIAATLDHVRDEHGLPRFVLAGFFIPYPGAFHPVARPTGSRPHAQALNRSRRVVIL